MYMYIKTQGEARQASDPWTAVSSVLALVNREYTEGIVNGGKFADFFHNQCCNCSTISTHTLVFHIYEEVVNLIKCQAGAKVYFLPPYSPDLMPAEGIFSQVKSLLKLFQVCTDPCAYLTLAFGMVTPADCLGHITSEQAKNLIAVLRVSCLSSYSMFSPHSVLLHAQRCIQLQTTHQNYLDC